MNEGNKPTIEEIYQMWKSVSVVDDAFPWDEE